MHDRRIDGEAQVFGNAGGLFMRAMTWYDHQTESIWSQPWGRAIIGPHKGVQLRLLPSQITTWEAWKTEHPETLVMVNDLDRVGGFRQEFSEDFVIGLLIDGSSKAFYFADVREAGVVNEFVGDIPVLVWADVGIFHAYIRVVDGQALTFDWQDGELIDRETGTIWDVSLGLAVEGALEGQALQPAPGSSAYDWAWLDFYPNAEFYVP